MNTFAVGDSISWAANVTMKIDGVLQTDLSGYTASCGFRRVDNWGLLAEANVTIAGTTLLIEVPGTITATWPIDKTVVTDVRFRGPAGLITTTGQRQFKTHRAAAT